MKFQSRFVYNLKERNGILYVLLLLMLMSFIFYVYRVYFNNQVSYNYHKTESLLAEGHPKKKKLSYIKKWKFNPNYINDYTGYALGMGTEEIDALLAYRESGRFVNSKNEFQRVTGISDSLLEVIAPGFVFPYLQKKGRNHSKNSYVKNKIIIKKDLNLADSTALTAVYGVGPVLAARIIKYRNFLGGFIRESQLNEVYGLKPDIVAKVRERFAIQSKPVIIRKDINRISLYDLAKTPYISLDLAKSIIAYRSKVGKISDMKELTKLQHFPTEEIDIIEVYLTTN
jgi:competence protein ComEA